MKIVEFLAWKLFNCDNFYVVYEESNSQVTFEEYPQMETISFQKQNTWISDKAFQGTVVNWICHFINKVLLKKVLN